MLDGHIEHRSRQVGGVGNSEVPLMLCVMNSQGACTGKSRYRIKIAGNGGITLST